MQGHLASSKVVVKSAFYNLLGFGASILYIVFLVPVVVGHIGVEQYGLWSIVLALTGYVGLADLGLSASFVKYVAEYVSLNEYARVNKVIQQGALFYLCLTLVMITIGPFLFSFVYTLLKIPSAQFGLASNAFMLSLVNFGVSSVAGVLASALTGIQRTDVFNRLVIASFVARYIAIVAVLVNGYGLLGFMIADLAVGAAFIVPLWFATKRYCPYVSLRFAGYDHGLMKSLLRFGFQLQISRFAELVQAQFDKLLITRYVNLGGVSMYDFGSRPLGRIRSLPVTAVSALVPAVSSLHAERDATRINAALVRGTKYLFIFGLPVFVFSVCFAHELIRVWLGDGFDNAALTLQILAPGYFVGVVVSVLALVSQGKGEPKYQMYAMMVQAGLNIVLSFILITSFGFFGAVSGTAVASVVGGLLFFHWYGKRLMDRPLSRLFGIAAKPLVSVALSVLACEGVASLMHASSVFGSRFGSLLIVVIAGLIFLILYVILLIATKVLTSDDRAFFINIIPSKFAHLLR
jgi:O-antigen/teichoic acid export membrane protein